MTIVKVKLPTIKEIDGVDNPENLITPEFKYLQHSYKAAETAIENLNTLINTNYTGNKNQFAKSVSDFFECFIQKDRSYNYSKFCEQLIHELPELLGLASKSDFNAKSEIAAAREILGFRALLSAYDAELFSCFSNTFDEITKFIGFLDCYFESSFMFNLKDGTKFRHFMGNIQHIEYYVNNHLVIQSKLPYLFTYIRLLKYNQINVTTNPFEYEKLVGALNGLIDEFYESQKKVAIIDFIDNNSNSVLDLYILEVHQLLFKYFEVTCSSKAFYDFAIFGKMLNIDTYSSSINLTTIYKAITEIEKKGRIDMKKKLINEKPIVEIKKSGAYATKNDYSEQKFNGFLNELNQLEKQLQL